MQAFIGARIPEEIIFTSGTISSINLVAQLMEQRLDSNQVVVSTMLEHHANFVPWQQLCLRRGASFVACGLTPEGDIDLDELDRVLSSSSVAIVAVAHDYIRNIGREQISERERMLTHHSRELLSAIDGLHIIGSPVQSCGCCSFMIDNVHPFDLASFIDKLGYALRSGNQCAQPLLHEFYGISNVCRLSPAFYNTEKEIVNCCLAIEKISGFLRKMVR